MSASEPVNNQQAESVVNRWLVDYYLYLAIDLFKKEQYDDFCGIRDVLDSVLVRPLECTDTMPTKIKVIQFLARINEGERLDLPFEADNSLTPLESALKLLQSMKEDCSIPQHDYEKMCAAVKEMIVIIFIKNGEFDKAKKALNKHFPKPMVGKKAILMGLINQKNKVHDIIDKVDFRQFKEKMLGFCLKLCQFTVPFLYKAAVQLIGKRHTEPDDQTDEPDQPGEPNQHASKPVLLVHCNRVIIQRSRLETAYNLLVTGSAEKTFSQLQEDIEEEQSGEKEKPLSLHLSPSQESANEETENQLYLRNSGSPLEASPADEPPQIRAVPRAETSSVSKMQSVPTNRRHYTVAQLVVEPDSQASSQCSTASQELDTEVTTKDCVESIEKSPEISLIRGTQSPLMECKVSKPVRKRQARTSASSHVAQPPHEPNEGQLDTEDEMEAPIHNTRDLVNMGPRQRTSNYTTVQEDVTLKRNCHKKYDEDCPNRDSENEDLITVSDGLDKSPIPAVSNLSPQTSSTPQKDKSNPQDKWKQLFNNAKESKDVWSDEEQYFDNVNTGSPNESTISNSGHRKRKWTDSETQRLKEGVQKFGEGNWNQIKAYCKFKDRTNVNLKDRWRTMKKLKMV